eukprot:comp20607_c0_seq1/m.41966 comp20607_c0_seq1/g.41966  ORF comp20607_c0_seq1/g.41966 comp20607_c0_seq1/m.41966 type:complete len:397 (-) comp20607_c0_seq1:30-1220(-)
MMRFVVFGNSVNPKRAFVLAARDHTGLAIVLQQMQCIEAWDIDAETAVVFIPMLCEFAVRRGVLSNADGVWVERSLLPQRALAKMQGFVAPKLKNKTVNQMFTTAYRPVFLLVAFWLYLFDFVYNLVTRLQFSNTSAEVIAAVQTTDEKQPFYIAETWETDILKTKLAFLSNCELLSSLVVGGGPGGYGSASITTVHPQESIRRITLQNIFSQEVLHLPCFESEQMCADSAHQIDAAESDDFPQHRSNHKQESTSKQHHKQQHQSESDDPGVDAIRGSFGDFLDRSIAGLDSEAWLHAELAIGCGWVCDYLDLIREDGKLKRNHPGPGKSSSSSLSSSSSSSQKPAVQEYEYLCPANERFRKLALKNGFNIVQMMWKALRNQPIGGVKSTSNEQEK